MLIRLGVIGSAHLKWRERVDRVAVCAQDDHWRDESETRADATKDLRTALLTCVIVENGGVDDALSKG